MNELLPYAALALMGFAIAVMLLRWIFRLNQILTALMVIANLDSLTELKAQRYRLQPRWNQVKANPRLTDPKKFLKEGGRG